MKSSKPNSTGSSAPYIARRSQPLRQTRSNPSRPNISGSRNNSSKTPLGSEELPAIDIFPAITHFADAISALPKELVRHFTLLKEVDAKIFMPEEELTSLVNDALNCPFPPNLRLVEEQNRLAQDYTPSNTSTNLSDSFINGCLSSNNTLTSDSDSIWNPSNINRRQIFKKCALTMQGMLVSLDEKNHVISTAGEALAKHLARIDDCLPYIELEISEEARNGSKTHWAYPGNRIAKTNNNSALRKENSGHAISAAAQQTVYDATTRSDARKQTLLEKKKGRQSHIDSDFDEQTDGKQKEKKINNTSKARKAAEVPVGITHGSATPNGHAPKRRKVEKVTAGCTSKERSPSTVSNNNNNIIITSTKGKTVSPRCTPQPEGQKKRSRAAPPSFNISTNKKRNNTVTPVALSPPLAVSPTRATFYDSKMNGNPSSPPPLNGGRPPSIRHRRNSVQSNIERQPPTPTSRASGHSASDSFSAVDIPRRFPHEDQSAVKESSALSTFEAPSEHTVPHDTQINGEVTSTGKKSVFHRSEANEANGNTTSAIQTTIITTTKSGRASKTSTPSIPSFNEPTRSRVSRLPLDSTSKRSHKRGMGAAAQLVSTQNIELDQSKKEQDDDIDIDVDEPRYCYCDNVSYGEMVGCDADGCKREWFHLACVGLKTAPKGNAKWYCEDCKDSTKGKGYNNSR
ncbi:Bgt-5200 [Blumeria graminis f. sp. tritici]|uniref:Chromatin modification-related protein n=2 Tax=Blumeria graminis f. sp. tritici TaxID=62690 RepID=A0A061HJ93_BLUGR|nr:component of the Rpd3 histone deacetylase complex [Blumeria graminis f. sp. tritici 96224]VDB89568.1 Bgt-5200 [Blumeria graminis f. sp. tritici]